MAAPPPAPRRSLGPPAPPHPFADTFWLVRSRGLDPALAGIGSSPLPGDIGWQQQPIPPEFTPNFTKRRKINLCGIDIPPNRTARIYGLEQAARIGFDTLIPPEEEGGPPVRVQKSIPIRDPDFRFPDGNLLWGLRFVPGRVDPYPLPMRDPLPVGFSNIQYTSRTNVLVATDVGTPPGNGLFDGEPVGPLGHFNDIAFPRGNTEYFCYFVEGPGLLLFQCSVFQTSSDRPVWTPPQGFDVSTLTQEEQFILTAQASNLFVRYTSCFGAIRCDIGPDPRRFTPERNPPTLNEECL